MSNATRRSVCQTLPRPAESRPFKSLIIHGVSEVGPPPMMTNARLEPPSSVQGLLIAFHTLSSTGVNPPPRRPSTLMTEQHFAQQLDEISASTCALRQLEKTCSGNAMH